MNYEKKYYKFKNKYLNLKKEIEMKQMYGSGDNEKPDIKVNIVKNLDNKLGYYEINYTDYKNDIINGVETKSVNYIIKMTYAPKEKLTFSIDEQNGRSGSRKENEKNELELTIDLVDKSSSNVKINGVFSEETKNVVKEALKKILESSYTNQIPRKDDVLIAQIVIYKITNEDGLHPLLWLAEDL
jgi:hypothetical protein